ncbi:uncharacterized protein LOC114750142 [Neltuma alba]|uniref:uncharacterized protein LOC114750142 n=1 Tax=Neltuma alba TaxID=207710 RepID=UPI0010A4355B|nr:uncharacterized protein LOC114750142 [Prosopis alba]
MLHRSFKPAKCKTALKLAVSRIKLLKNRREALVKQHKRELAQLLESGQDQTARIRVEHVVREEKTMAAYDLIEIYCELIAARLPMIESQKNCPIDLKEAISSVIFASPRCSDIPELMDVRKHITAKYGKEFISAAVELRPDCGVNRLLVEKLSAKAPDGPTKMKILTAIAEEHNIKWEPKSFGESDVKLSQGSQVGTNAYEKGNYVEPPQVHVPLVRDEMGPPNLRGFSEYEKMQNTPTNLVEATNDAEKMVGGGKSTTSGTTSPGIRSSGTGNQEMDSAAYYENRRGAPTDNINWNMEFKDAASAAQAAAESAERASMAARAAAELSNRDRINRQYSGGSQSSSGSGLRHEVPQEFLFHDDKHLPTERSGMTASAAPEQSNHEKTSRQYSTGSHISRKSNELPYPPFHDEIHISTGSADNIVRSSSLAMHNEEINRKEQDRPVRAPDEYYRDIHENVLKRPQSTSFTSRGPFNDDNPFAVDSKMANLYPENSLFRQESSDYLYEVSMEKGASGTEVDVVSEQHADMDTGMKNYDLFGGGRMDRQSRNASPSGSHFSMTSDNRNDVFKSNDPKINNSPVGDLSVTDEGNIHSIYMETTSHDDTPVVFDDSASEDDDYKFLDKTHVEEGSGSFFSSLDNKSHADPLANTNAWSPGQVVEGKETGLSSQSHFSEVSESLRKSAVSSGKEDLPPVTFDDSDGPSSDSEEDMVKSNVTESYNHGNSFPGRSANHEALESSSLYDKNVDSDRKLGLSSSLADLDTVEENFKGKIDITSVPGKNYSYDELPTNRPSSEVSSSLSSNFKTSVLSSKSPHTSDESLIEESGKELNYGSLKGGFRNKGIRRPPYLKSSNKGSSSLEDIPVQDEGSFPSRRTSVNSDAHRDAYKSKVSSGRRSMVREQKTLDSDSFNPDPKSHEDRTDTQDPHIQKPEESEARKKSRSKVSYTYFDSDSSYSEDEVPRQNSDSRARPASGFPRRTATSSKSGASSTSKEAPSASGSGLVWKSSRAYNDSEKQKMASSRMVTSDNVANPEHGSAEKAAFKPIPDSRKSLDEVTRPSAKVQPSHPLPRTVTPDNAEASGSPSTDRDAPSNDKAAASHVHPKLPDYDSFAAHFLSLKKGRQ